ncbi:MAG TPA: histidine phosphatase family protein [Thermoanaerobaculia bacterium]|nr:histidine phosphatase family protein [Thermoanaerobaculia bacterium]
MSLQPYRIAGGGFRLLLAMILLSAVPAAALDTVYLVRHAEKSEGWPPERDLDAFWPLSPGGQVRAEWIASRLEDRGIAAVYTSRTTRTLTTGLPLANRIRVPISANDDSILPEKMDAFLAALRGKHPGDKAVLIVGHSNTIPLLLARLGATPDCHAKLGIVRKGETFLIEGYDGLWKVDLKQQGCEALSKE